MRLPRNKLWISLLLPLLICVAVVGLGVRHEVRAREGDALTYVGAQSCVACHAGESEAWRHSHHAVSMQRATSGTVLGDFSNTRFEHAGIGTTFSRKDGNFVVQDGWAGWGDA